MAGWFSIIVQFILRGFGIGQKKPDTTVQTLASSNATATADLATEGEANAQLVQAAAARNAADAARVRSDPAGDAITTDPTATVNSSPDAHFRD